MCAMRLLVVFGAALVGGVVATTKECSWLESDIDGNLFIVPTTPSISQATHSTTTFTKFKISTQPHQGQDTILIDTKPDSSRFSFTELSREGTTPLPLGTALVSKPGYAITTIDLSGTPFAIKNGRQQFSSGFSNRAFVRTSCAGNYQRCSVLCGLMNGGGERDDAVCGPSSAIALGRGESLRGGAFLELKVLNQAEFDKCIADPSRVLVRSCDWMHVETNVLTNNPTTYYLSLPQGNIASYPDLTTQWSKVKIGGPSLPSRDSSSIVLDTSDFTFAQSEGTTLFYRVQHMPFGTAMDCKLTGSMNAKTVINLENTPFAIETGEEQFAMAGRNPKSSFVCEKNNQVCTLICGGDCGYCGSQNAVRSGHLQLLAGGEHLRLQVVDPDWFGNCIDQAAMLRTKSTTPSSQALEISLGLVIALTAFVFGVFAVWRKYSRPGKALALQTDV